MAGFKSMLGVLAIVLLVFGTIFILQGLNVSWAPKSYMTSDINWSYRGAVFDVAGLILLVLGLRGGWRNILGAGAALALVVGALWVAQGLNLAPGMGMSGHMEWAIRGAIVFAVGAALAFIAAMGAKSA